MRPVDALLRGSLGVRAKLVRERDARLAVGGAFLALFLLLAWLGPTIMAVGLGLDVRAGSGAAGRSGARP